MVPCVMLAGDKNQMGSPGGRPCFFSPSWDRWTRTTTLRYGGVLAASWAVLGSCSASWIGFWAIQKRLGPSWRLLGNV
eukprot:7894804-Pyramimonas_sp.AAC.1